MLFLVVCGFLLWILAVLGLSMVALDQCMDHSQIVGGIAAAGAFVLFAAGIMLVISGKSSDEQRCLDAGRAWMRTGSHVGMVMVGKVLVPQRIPDYGCVDVAR